MKSTFLLIAVFLFSFSEQADSQWVQSKGSLREHVSCLAISKTSILAGTDSRGVYLSSDSGSSWSKLTWSLDNNQIYALGISDSNFIAATYSGVYISTDKGGSWFRGAIGIRVNTLAISGKNIFAGTDHGLYLSTDNGLKWTGIGLSNSYILSLTVSGGNVYAATDTYIFYSSDNGKSWTQTNFPSGASGLSLAALGKNLYVACRGGLYRSIDNSTSWNKMDGGLKNNGIQAIIVSDTCIFVGADDGLYKSADSGTSWLATSADPSIIPFRAIGILGSNVIVGTSTGVFHSINNGVTWAQDNELPLNSVIVTFDSLGKNIIAGAYRNNGNEIGGGVFFSSDHGSHWAPTNLYHENVRSLSVLDTNLFAGSDSGVFLSTDNGKNWTQAGLRSRRVNAFVLSGRSLYACTDSGVFLSGDNGASWIFRGLPNIQVNGLAIMGTNLYAGTNEGFILSNDNGNSWVKTGLTKNVTSLAVLDTNIFAGTEYGTGGIHLSTDSGSSWSTVNTGLPNNGNIYVVSFAISGTNVLIGTVGYGVFLSTDNGSHWKNMGLVGTDIPALTIIGIDIYTGGYGGVWRRPLSEIIPSEVKTSSTNFPTRFQNFPNPFNATTKITFDLQHSAFVSLKILDVLGREVSVLVDEKLPAGLYSRDWNASAFLPGEYFYRLQAGAYSETNKLMLVK